MSQEYNLARCRSGSRLCCLTLTYVVQVVSHGLERLAVHFGGRKKTRLVASSAVMLVALRNPSICSTVAGNGSASFD